MQVGEKKIVSHATLAKKGTTHSDEDENVLPCDDDDTYLNYKLPQMNASIKKHKQPNLQETSRERAYRLRQ